MSKGWYFVSLYITRFVVNKAWIGRVRIEPRNNKGKKMNQSTPERFVVLLAFKMFNSFITQTTDKCHVFNKLMDYFEAYCITVNENNMSIYNTSYEIYEVKVKRDIFFNMSIYSKKICLLHVMLSIQMRNMTIAHINFVVAPNPVKKFLYLAECLFVPTPSRVVSLLLVQTLIY